MLVQNQLAQSFPWSVTPQQIFIRNSGKVMHSDLDIVSRHSFDQKEPVVSNDRCLKHVVDQFRKYVFYLDIFQDRVDQSFNNIAT